MLNQRFKQATELTVKRTVAMRTCSLLSTAPLPTASEKADNYRPAEPGNSKEPR